jgi:hypothetical protein
MPNLPSNLYDKIYDRLTDSKRGIKRDLEIGREGPAKILSLRSAYSGTGAALSDPPLYVDESVRGEDSVALRPRRVRQFERRPLYIG